MQTALTHGHDTTWAPADATVDRDYLPSGDPIALVESADPTLYRAALALGARYIACGDRTELVASYLDGVDPGRVSVRREALARLRTDSRRAHVDALLDDAREGSGGPAHLARRP